MDEFLDDLLVGPIEIELHGAEQKEIKDERKHERRLIC
jgi:hypothetical protein